MRTNEIYAYNYGRAAHNEGLEAIECSAYALHSPIRPLQPAELRGLGQLGPERFAAWALRGWLDAARESVT